jgi:hypothetical protein
VRELSKVMDGATVNHAKMLYRVIKYVLNTKNRGIRVKPNQENGCIAYVDSDYAGDRENRRSVTGYLIYLSGAPIAWKSRQQGGITLSSSEAEYYAISEVAKEMKFVKMILTGELVKIYVDSIGAIHLSNNAVNGLRTKHIDTRVPLLSENSPKEKRRYWKLSSSGAKIIRAIPSRRIHRKKCSNDTHPRT